MVHKGMQGDRGSGQWRDAGGVANEGMQGVNNLQLNFPQWSSLH